MGGYVVAPAGYTPATAELYAQGANDYITCGGGCISTESPTGADAQTAGLL